jgi:predicted ABC-type ATPase
MVKNEYNIHNYFIYDIDGKIENNENYQREIKKCIDYYKTKSNKKSLEQEKIKKCTNIYFKYRTESMFNELDKQEEEAKNKSMSIIYETTGCRENSIKFIIDSIKKYKELNYIIILYYPLVSSDILKKRSFKRAKVTGRYIPDKFICVDDAIKNIEQIINYIDDIYIYNNITSDIKYILKWKSTTKEIYCNKKELEFFKNYTKLYNYIINLYNRICQTCNKKK